MRKTVKHSSTQPPQVSLSEPKKGVSPLDERVVGSQRVSLQPPNPLTPARRFQGEGAQHSVLPDLFGPNARFELHAALQERLQESQPRVVLKVYDRQRQCLLVLKAVAAPPLSQAGQDMVKEWLQLARWQNGMLPQAGDYFPRLKLPGQAGEWVGFTQTFLAGESLRALLERLGHLPEAQLEALARQLLLALDWFEAGGMAGLDLKPEHLIFGPEGWRLLDLEQAQTENPLRNRGVAGTVRYAAPELLEGLPADIRSDLFSVGRILLEASTEGFTLPAHRTLPELAQKLRQGPLLSPQAQLLLAEHAPGLRPLLLRLLEADPSGRPSSALEALDLLEASTGFAGMRREETRATGRSPQPLVPLPPVGGRHAHSFLRSDGWLHPAPGQEQVFTRVRELLSLSPGAGPDRPTGVILTGKSGAGNTRCMLDLYRDALLLGCPALYLDLNAADTEAQDGRLQDGRLQDGRLQDGRLQDGRLPADLAERSTAPMLMLGQPARTQPFALASRLLDFLRRLLPNSAAQPQGDAAASPLDWNQRAVTQARQLAQLARRVGETLAGRDFSRPSSELQPIPVVFLEHLALADEPSLLMLAELLPLLPDLPLLLVIGPVPQSASDHAPTGANDPIPMPLRKQLTTLEALELPPLTEAGARALADELLSQFPLNQHQLTPLFHVSEGLAGRFVRALHAHFQHRNAGNTTPSPDLLLPHGQASDWAPDSDPLRATPTVDRDELLRQAHEALEDGQLLLARSLFQRILSSPEGASADMGQPELLHSEARLQLAEVACLLGSQAEALRILEEDPFPESLRGKECAARARVLKALGKFTSALALLEGRALEATGGASAGTKGATRSSAPSGVDLDSGGVAQADVLQRLPLVEQLSLSHMQTWLYLVLRRPDSALQLLRMRLPLLARVEGRSGDQTYTLTHRTYEIWARMLLFAQRTPEQRDPATQEQMTRDLFALVAQAERMRRRPELQRVRSLLSEWGRSLSLPETRSWLETEVAEACEAFELTNEASARTNLARFLRQKDELPAALDALVRAEAIYRRTGDFTNQSRVLLLRTEICLQASRLDAAASALSRALSLLEQRDEGKLRPWSLLLEAQLACRVEPSQAAAQKAEAAYTALLSSGQSVLALRAGLEWVEALLSLDARDHARRVCLQLAPLLQPETEDALLQRYQQAMSRVLNPAATVQTVKETPAEGRVSNLDLTWLDRMEYLIAHAHSSEQLAAALAEVLSQLLGGRAVVLLEGSEGPVVAHTGLSLAQREDMSRSVVTRVLAEQRPWICPDLLAIEDGTGASVRDKGYRSVVCVPIVQGSHGVGVLYADHQKEGAITSGEALKAIERVAQVAGSLLSGLTPALEDAADDDLPSYGLIGNSPAMRSLRQEILRLGRKNDPGMLVMLRGEPGCGKSTVARILHRIWLGDTHPFVSYDVSTAAETLIAAELFGIAPNSYLGGGSRAGRPGKFEQANGGTFFMDEAQNLPLSHQSSLLLPFSEQQVNRVGGTEPVRLVLRFVVAASRDLRELRDEGLFLPALVGRLWRNPVRVPTLLERGPEDFRLLTAVGIQKALGSDRLDPRSLERAFEPKTLQFMLKYSWPGNVRELMHVLDDERVKEYLQQGVPLTLQHIEDLLEETPARLQKASAPAIATSELLAPEGRTLTWLKEFTWRPFLQRYAQRELERLGTKLKTAETMGVTRSTLDNLLDGKKGQL